MTKKLTPEDYGARYEAKRQAGVLEMARAWAADKGEAFIVFVGGVPGQFCRTQDAAVDVARRKVKAGTASRDSLSIKRIKV